MLRNGSFSQNYFITDDSLDNKLTESREDNVVPLLMLNYKYERLKPYVIDSNLLVVSGQQLFDVVERTESPYTQHRVFNACTAFKIFYGTTARFIIDSSYYFTNDNTAIAKIECNWGDGIGYRLLNWGDTISVAYPDEYARLVSSRIILVSGDTLASSFYFKMTSDACDDEYPHDIIAKIEATIPYPEGAVYPTATTSAKYTVTYGFETDGVTKHTCIKKPMLFVSGFDPGYLNYPTTFEDCKYGRLGWIDVITGDKHDLEKGTIEPWDPEFLEGPEFFTELFNLGYDVIFLDFKDGTNYMQRNAFVLVEMINWINANKCSDEENIIIGASMGGQLVRYALTYMEKNNIPHCTKLNINFDSPAQGANILLGLQGFVDFGYDVFPDFLEAAESFDYQINMLQSPAAKQLLVPHFEGDPSNKLINNFRTTFYDELFALDADGYPNNAPTLAIANGNKTATPQSTIEESQQFLNLIYDFGIIKIEAEAYLLPGHPLFGYAFKGFWEVEFGIGIGFISIGFNFVEGIPVGTPNYDTAPGAMQTGLQEQLTGGYTDLWLFSVFDVTADNFCFVPTISALDIETANLLYNVDAEIPPNASDLSYPFEAYYAPFPSAGGNNENHVQLSNTDIDASNTGNLNWAVDKMELYSYNLTASLPATVFGTLENTFNYGNKYKRFLHSLNINDGGLLQINGNYATDYGDGDPTISGSTFTVTTSECNITTVNINDGGIFEIGDDNTPANNKGIVELLSGSAVNINSGGLLKIHKNSKLYIRDGAIVTIEAGSTLQVEDYGEIIVDAGGQLFIKGNAVNLAGANAKLTLNGDGKIIIEDEMDFTFTGAGYFNYYDDGIIWLGDNSKFILQGTGVTDRKMKLNTNALLHITSHDVEINDCKIEYASGSSFKHSWNNVNFDYVNCVDLSTGSAAHAIEVDDVFDLLVNQSTFDGFNSAIKIDDITTCPGEINININYSTFTNHTFAAIEANNVERMRLNTSTLTGKDASVQAGLFLEDVVYCELHNATVKQYTMNNTDAAGIFAKNVDGLVIDGAAVRSCHDGIESRNSNIFVRSGGVIKLNTNGINFLSALEIGGTPTELNRLVVGDIGCGWIIQNDYGVIGEDVLLDIDQQIHANASDNPFLIYPNRFDGNAVKVFEICYTHYTGASIATPIPASHCYWTGGTAPAASTYKIGFSADPQCDNITLSTPNFYTSQPTTCDCIGGDCNTNPTNENIQARLGSTSCNYTIAKQGGGTISIANQYRDAYMHFANHEYNYAYAKFNWLNNKVNAQYGSSGLPNGICRQLHQSSARLLPICDALATSFCLYPFWIDEKSDESIVETLNLYEIHPNPANTFITFSSLSMMNSNYKIFAPNGAMVSEGNFEATITIDVSEYARGIYLVQFYSLQNELLETIKFVLQ